MPSEFYESTKTQNGQRPTWDDVEVVQALADGEVMTKFARTRGRKYSGLNDFLLRLRVRAGIKTNAQLVAHYIRNGWID